MMHIHRQKQQSAEHSSESFKDKFSCDGTIAMRVARYVVLHGVVLEDGKQLVTL